ncbi:hypothetical protein BZA05DRAFT_405783 [Tricharina praecox]|uniref:uncharacterized protein n=1 Tax=Tricharina praecox TaxID=43433 RepID=UPI00221F8804|nr:uncharacterized protein BZA05DRAFT_405783 [Tricharina praecox]KAI5846887.1 hypothetical protein BZA05DRAFT_405783 [Tricharina praecox]
MYRAPTFPIMITMICLLQPISSLPGGASARPPYGWRPTLNETALKSHAPTWVPEPGYRGTLTILRNCTLMIVLAVCSALHLNVPAQGEGRFPFRRYRRGVKWAVMALILPEAVLVFAFIHLHEALRLCHDLERHNERTSDERTSDERTSDERPGSAVIAAEPPRATSPPSRKSNELSDNDNSSTDGSASDERPGSIVIAAEPPRAISPASRKSNELCGNGNSSTDGTASAIKPPFRVLWKSVLGSLKKFPLKYGFHVGMGGFAFDTTKLGREDHQRRHDQGQEQSRYHRQGTSDHASFLDGC